MIVSIALYAPISIACVIPGIFPQVALYTESRGNYVLYKDETGPFTEDDSDRLLNNNVSTMYVRIGDFDEVSRFAEENLSQILQREDVDHESKCDALCQTSSSYLSDIFSDPEKSQDAARCQKLTGHLAKHISENRNIASLFEKMSISTPFAVKHSLQVAAISMLTWSKLFPEQSDLLVDVGVASMLHDIGMCLIMPNLSEEKDYWTSPSVDEIKRHPIEGYVFLRKNGQYSDLVLDAVRHHHERYFGGGYPGGLKGDEIRITTQVVGLADMYCTLVVDRPTRKASTPEEALAIINDETHKCFSTLLFTAFKSIIMEQLG
jgi:HD-GYP domain-containing protein (c-di-GMP phosphodiesterase class II)